jgi:hypothetical protein
MSVESVQTKWGPLDRHSLKALKDGYAEGEGLTPCSCH